jgi:hypothetical protein
VWALVQVEPSHLPTELDFKVTFRLPLGLGRQRYPAVGPLKILWVTSPGNGRDTAPVLGCEPFTGAARTDGFHDGPYGVGEGLTCCFTARV